MVHGFYKSCGIKGCLLSSSQKQRVALARVLIRSPKILLLDRALDRLEEGVFASLAPQIDSIRKERTTLIVSDQQSVVEKCDRIVVICRGKVIEEGTWQALR
mmetsp:Transcript_48796/g.35916  ORF Transcript_48796/g.35916 Transcript_48796/m.35916 type:complete len:102 (-) Transcript_48796:164-469(-)